jgi:hypothetical protein
MSAEDEYDLTGEWSGIYNYPHTLPPNAFEASIRDSGGIITGVIRQPGEFFEPPGTRQHAVIEGTREGSRVRWIKIYDDLTRAPPRYEGTVQPGGDEIEGQWHHPGDWSGTFLMVRGRKAKAEEEHKVDEEIPIA